MRITNEKECQKALGKLDNMIAEGFQGDLKNDVKSKW
jgi:hypothetical protein